MSSHLLELDVSQLQNISLSDDISQCGASLSPPPRRRGTILTRLLRLGGCGTGTSLLQEDDGSSSRYIPPPWTSPSLARRITERIATSPLINRRNKETESANFVTIEVVHDSQSIPCHWSQNKRDAW